MRPGGALDRMLQTAQEIGGEECTHSEQCTHSYDRGGKLNLDHASPGGIGRCVKCVQFLPLTPSCIVLAETLHLCIVVAETSRDRQASDVVSVKARRRNSVISESVILQSSHKHASA